MDADQAPSSPRSAFKTQLEHLAAHHVQNRQDGHIFTKDLLSIFDEYERQYDVLLLTDTQKESILPYCLRNPDLEMSSDDIVRLLTLVMSPSQPLPSPCTQDSSSCIQSVTWERCSFKESPSSEPGDTNLEEDNDEDEDNPSSAVTPVLKEDRKYRYSVDRLKLSERRLASLARDNEDRIVDLQNRVDDMSQEVVKQKKEIGEYKHKEKSSLEQINALEEHISAVERSETDQKQVYLSLRTLFDEKCEETLILQGMLKQKETDLETTESFLNKLRHEIVDLMSERERMAGLQNSLERELEISHHAHQQLAEQRSENERLKEIIDGLRYDLDEARNEQPGMRTDMDRATLKMELGQDTKPCQTDVDCQSNDTLEDIEQMKHELAHLRLALDSENRSLINQLADLKTRRKDESDTAPSSDVTPTPTPSTTTMAKTQSMPARFCKSDQTKRRSKMRVAQDLSVLRTTMFGPLRFATAPVAQPLLPGRYRSPTDDKVVPNTVTFALYTLLVYIFGIVTSTFLIENGPPGSWEQAIVAAASTPQGQRSKLLEIVLYWIEKLLFEGEGIPLQ